MRFKVGDYFPDFIFNTAYRKNLQVHEVLDKETVFWCIRYIGCPVCRYDVHCIKEKYAEIQKKNAQIFVVMQSDQKHIQDVIKEDELPFEIICDPEKKFYNELEIDPALSKEELIGHNTDELEQKRQACKELGYTHGDYEGDELQLPALFIVNKKGIIKYVKYGDSLVSLPTVDELIDLL